jgi:type II secretory pathway pseudopilin PulG
MLTTSLGNERGFTMMELLVASVTTVIVLGGAVALTSQVQNGYRRQLEDSAAEQEGRYVLDWVGRYIRGAGNNPANALATECPPAPNPAPTVPATGRIAFVEFDPNDDGEDNDVRLLTDANPADGLVGGPDGGCDQSNEDVTISHDPATNTITFLDNNTGGAITTRTDTVIEDLEFIFRDVAHAEVDSVDQDNAEDVVYIETRITIRTRTINAAAGVADTRVLSQEIKIRSRG